MISDFIAHVGSYLDTHPALRDFAIYAGLSLLAAVLPQGKAQTVLSTLVADFKAFLPEKKP